MAILTLFKSRLPSCRFIFPSGKEAIFIAGRFTTDDADEIRVLKAEVKGAHPHIFIDDNEKSVDSERLDPLEEIKRKAIEEYIASQAAAINPSNDMGTTDHTGKLEGIQNTDTLNGSNTKTAIGARLANVKHK